MKTLKSFDFKSSSGHSAYPWHELLDGKIHQLEEGKDYACKASNLVVLARRNAEKLGMAVRATKIDGGLVIQAYTPADNGQA
jgi:hypothetical protein